MQDVWRGLTWDMSIDRAVQVLKRQRLKVDDAPRKGFREWISTKVDGRDATVYFDPYGRMNQISLWGDPVTKKAADAARERFMKRFGPVKETSHWTEHIWGWSAAPHARLYVYLPEEGWVAREEYRRDKLGDPVGVFDLKWGHTAPDVEQRLRAAGFEARTIAQDPDPCRMPNHPPSCEPGENLIVEFDEGSATVHKTRGLEEFHFSVKVASYEDGIARAKAMENVRGPATEIEDATITEWEDATTHVSLDVRVTKPAGTVYTLETYRPRR